MHARTIDMTGRRIGRLLVIAESDRKGKGTFWVCRCDCGNTKVMNGHVLRRGEANGCGCLRTNSRRTHGGTGTKEYVAWQNAIQRCEDPTVSNWERYGGRGISMCPEWRSDFAAFLKDMGPCPPRHSIERIDNDRGYSPDNCRWSTWREQMNNTSRNRVLTIDGVRMSAAQAAAKTGINYGTLVARLRRGWSDARAVSA